MKTSVEIDDALYRRARIRAVEAGTTLRALIEAGLKAVLPPLVVPESNKRVSDGLGAMRAIQARFAAASTGESRSDEELAGYDDDGLPS